jgi:hypothetical protein
MLRFIDDTAYQKSNRRRPVMNLKIMLFLLAAAFLVTAGACGVSSKKDKIPTPQASSKGMGVAAASAATNITPVMAFMSQFLQQAAAAPASVKSPASAKLAVGNTLDCDSGNVEVTSLTPFTVTAHDCLGNNGTVLAPEGATMTGALVSTVACPTDGDPLILPQAFTVVLNGPILIDDVKFNFESLGMTVTGITYGPSNVASPFCAVTGFSNLVTGKMGSSDPVDLSFDFGTGGMAFFVTVDPDSVASIDLSGTMTLITPCFNGSFTLLTVDSMVFPPGATCPTSGHLQLTGDVNDDVFFPDDCNNPACVLGL